MIIRPGASADLVDGRAPDGVTLEVYVPLGPGDRTERPITVDQTNVSVVVGERAVVKWMRSPAAGRAPHLLAHLAATGFTRMPTPHAAAFRDGALIALVTAYLPDAEDGWDWCTDAVLSWLDAGAPAGPSPAALPPTVLPPTVLPPTGLPPAGGGPVYFGAALGSLAAELHSALATPSLLFPHPVAIAPRGNDPAATLASALECAGDDEDGEWLRSIAPRLKSDISDLSPKRDQDLAIHLHGDLHVGQILRWRGGLAVTDFDGNPTVEPRPEPVARDLAQLRTSVLHVAEIANRRTDGRHRATLLDWSRRTADDLLTAYRDGLTRRGHAHLLDEDLLRPYEIEQECRELIYAARFLPRWRYAPMGVLRSWYG